MKTKQPTKNRRKIDHTFAQQWQICKSNEAKEENLQREVLENEKKKTTEWPNKREKEMAPGLIRLEGDCKITWWVSLFYSLVLKKVKVFSVFVSEVGMEDSNKHLKNLCFVLLKKWWSLNFGSKINTIDGVCFWKQ